MKLQKLFSYTRQAIDKYHMIEANDHIAIGISGGKDSLALLYALSGLQKFYPQPYRLTAITIDLGYKGFDLSSIQTLCRELNVEYHIIRTKIGEMITSGNFDGSACSLCSR